jgi:protein-disulfide isomerase
MKEFIQRNVTFIIISLVTLAVIVGGVSLMTDKSRSSPSSTPLDTSFLITSSTYKTSGLSGGSYLPANPSATINVVEFGDFQCPACAYYTKVIDKILTDLPGQIVYSFRNYPIPGHKYSLIAAYALEAAGIQGKYFEMLDKLYSGQNEWETSDNPQDIFVNYATELGLNTKQFSLDINSQAVKDAVQKDKDTGDLIRLTETPTIYINGEKYVITDDPNGLENTIKSYLSE